MENLWNPEFLNKIEPTPKEVLATQAGFLREMSNGKILATIKTTEAYPSLDKDAREFGNECFLHSFRIVVPSLDYSFTMLRLVHETLKVKPFQVYANLTEKKYSGDSIEDLQGILKEIITSKEVSEAISNLLSQA